MSPSLLVKGVEWVCYMYVYKVTGDDAPRSSCKQADFLVGKKFSEVLGFYKCLLLKGQECRSGKLGEHSADF